MDMISTMARTPSESRPAPSTGASVPMPDIAQAKAAGYHGTLDWVGMSDIEVPIRLDSATVVPARGAAYVSLDDAEAKGIHMSRLFLAMQAVLPEKPLAHDVVAEVLRRFIKTHDGLSQRARLSLQFELPLRRKALVSDHYAWRGYPVSLSGDLGPDGFRLELSVRVTYSSTCPCSAALARQLIQERFDRDFAQQGSLSAEEMRAWLGTEAAICATPHSQRSHADVRVVLQPQAKLDHKDLIDMVEESLKTPVQAAVKREDEQEFARLNGQNLMFCEDAGRRLKALFDQHPAIADFHITASHRESLHPHDAVSIAVKGIAGGYRP